MSGNRTHGYDMVLELNDQVLNDAMPAEFFPPLRGGLETDFGGLHFSVDYEVFFPESPSLNRLHFDTSIPDGVVVTTPFSLNITDLDIDPGPRNLHGAINGTVSLHHSLIAYDDSEHRCIGFDFTTLPVDRITVDITESPDIPAPEDAAEQLLATLLHTYLQENVQRFELFRVRLVDDADPFTPEALDVRVITDGCAALLVSTTSSTAGDRSAFTSCDIPAGVVTRALMISSRTLLMEVLCPAVLDALDLSGDAETFFAYADGAVELLRPVDISDLVDNALVDRITLTAMRFATGDDWLEATASLHAEGFGYQATAQLGGRVEISMDADGNVVLEYSAEVADVELLVYPWVYVLIFLGLALLPAIGGIVAIVLPVLPWILNPVLDAIAAHLHVEGEVEGEFPPFPIHIDTVMLDDLLCAGRAVIPPSSSVPLPDLWIDGEMVTTDCRVTDFSTRELVGPVTETRITFSSSNAGRYVARTTRMMFPITYEWRLAGYAISGTGDVSIDGVTVHHELNAEQCTLSLDYGESLSGVLAVQARSVDGTGRSASTDVEVEGSREVRSYQNVWVLEGPMADLRTAPSVRETLPPIDWPTPPFKAGQPYAVSAGVNRMHELRNALKAGTGYDFPPESFG